VPDDDLGARLRAGDPEALRALYQRYAGAVLTVARAFLADREAADDVVQQTFLQAWRAAHRIDPGRSLSPWLYQIARNCAIDALRRSARTPLAAAPSAEIAAPGTPTFEQTWEAFEVRRAIDELPEVERDTVRLAHLDGLTHPEIAAFLGVPIGTVKSRLGRAYRRLEESLAHLDGQQSANRPARPHVVKSEGPR